MKKSYLQIYKALKLFIVLTLFLITLECIFLIEGVQTFFTSWFDSAGGWTIYLVVWLLMFLQGTILNIPGVTILQLSILAGLKVLTPVYIIVVVSASVIASIVSYGLGAKFGTKAVKWIAGDVSEFNKWSTVINAKTKWWYFGTVILPIFPDDILSIVAGSLRLDFKFYCFANIVGKLIGTITMLLTLQMADNITSGEFPLMLVVWLIGLIAEIIALFIIKHKINKAK